MNPVYGPILVVEDDRDILYMISAALQDEGYTVAPVGSGELAIRVAYQLQPQVVLLDLMLGTMDGSDVGRVLGDILGPTVPIVLVSGLTPKDIAGTADDIHAFGILHKPFELDHLLEIVEAGCAEAKRRRQPQGQARVRHGVTGARPSATRAATGGSGASAA